MASIDAFRVYFATARGLWADMRDDLWWNKIFGAILATLLVIFVLRQGTEMVFASHPPAKPGDAIAVQIASTAPETAAPDVPPDWGTVLPKADPAAGMVVSQKCQSCHTFTDGGANGTGPNQWGLIGRQPGSHAGFTYSAAMVDFGKKNPAWTYSTLYMFLANPQSYVDGTKMSFVGLKNPQDRINLIAWLRQQSSSPAAIPAPDPKAAAAAAAPAPSSPGPAPENGDPSKATSAAVAAAPAAGAAGASTAVSSQSGTGAAATPTAESPAPGGAPK